MAKPITMDDGGDSADLQDLFDSIAGSVKPPEPPPPPPPEPSAAGDSDDLQALFDSVAGQSTPAAPTPAGGEGGEGDAAEAMFNRIGHLARQLHDSMRELGYDRVLEDSAKQIPDARQRLAYIAQMTEQAASRVLNAADVAKPIQDRLIVRAEGMGQRWERMFANQLSVDEFKALAADTRAFFGEAPAELRATNAQLSEIVLAQDFQDLTGQVIKKVVDMVQGLEGQLLKVLIEMVPENRKPDPAAANSLMNGPVIDTTRADVLTSQAQVDDLLESLGF